MIDPPETDGIIGNIESATFDERGGTHHSYEHGITVSVPSGAIPTGVKSQMKLAATLTAPVILSDNAKLVSAIVWLCMNVTLQKPVLLKIPHYASIKSKAHSKTLQFAKAKLLTSNTNTMRTMKVMKGGNFPVDESYGSIEISHFCYYCINLYQASDKIPHYSYRVVTMKEKQPNLEKRLWLIAVCIIPSLATCLKVIIFIVCINLVARMYV